MPVLDPTGRCVGLIDAESWTPKFFDHNKVAIVARCALDLADELVVDASQAQAPLSPWKGQMWGAFGQPSLSMVSMVALILMVFMILLQLLQKDKEGQSIALTMPFVDRARLYIMLHL